MKKHLLKSLLALALVLITGNAWGESYTITFSNSVKSATAISATTKASTVIGSGTEYVTDQPFTVTGNCYYGDTKTCIRLGKSGNSASLSIELSEAGQVNATSIVVNCMNTGGKNNTGATISAFGKDGQTTSDSDAADYTFGLEGTKITSINLASDKAIYVYSITVNYSTTPVPPTPTKELVSLEVSGTPTKTSYTEGDEFDPAGLVVTGTYDDATTDDLTDDAEWTFDPATFTSTSQTSVSVTAKVGEVESESYNVNVIVTEKPALPSYTLVTDASTLKDGDIIVLGAVKDGTWYVNAGINGKFLDAKEATCTDNILESEDAAEIELEKCTNGWHLKIGDKYINTTAAKALTFADDASTAWTIEIEDGNATIAAGDYGRFLYNAGSPRFLNYAFTTSTNVSMILPSIFKKEASLPETFNVEISSVGFATMYLEFDAAIPSDVTAYTATYAEKTITLHEIEGGIIPAETAVVLKGVAGDYDFVKTAYTGETLENVLRGTTEESSYEMLQGTETDKYVYTLNQGDNGVGFFHMTNADDSKLAANRAYLLIPVADFEDGAGTIGFRFGDATQIENVNAVEAGKYFDLQGREVLNPAGGIYILNGKKVLVK